ETVPRAGYRLVEGEVAARGLRRWQVAAAVVAVLGIILAAVIMTRETGRRQGNPPMPTIALLPFSGDDAEPKVRELANSTRASLAHTLIDGVFPVRLVAPDAVSPGKSDLIISGDIVSENGGA